MIWNNDISTAPRGHMITVMKNTRTKDGVIRSPVQEFAPDYIWLSTKCEKVMKSYWIPETDRNPGRWAGFANGELPVAWQEFVTPIHPYALARLRETTNAAVAHLQMVDGVGGQ